ncbi:MAG: RAMP superfamily CRISPR-associated protein [Bacillota bacterium]
MLDHRRLVSRYRLTGVLTLETALHIGTGQTGSLTDSPVLRDAMGRPFIPGSSLKGAFRAAVARVIPNLGLQACDPFGDDDFCVSPQKGPKSRAYLAVRRFLGTRVPREGGGQEAEEARKALTSTFTRPEWVDHEITEAHLVTLLEGYLCSVCKVFGSPHYAARARFDDLPVQDWYQVTETRDGVGIDRDSERAGEKFDFEVVPAGTTFRFGLIVDNPSEQDLGLVAIGLREMEEGMIRLGGIRSRGLGRCVLRLDPVQHLDASDRKALVAYLKGEGAGTIAPGEFLARAIEALMQGGETRAEAAR